MSLIDASMSLNDTSRNVNDASSSVNDASSSVNYAPISVIGFHRPLDGLTNLKYKLLCFLTPNKKFSERKALAFNQDRCCHLALCLRLILFH